MVNIDSFLKQKTASIIAEKLNPEKIKETAHYIDDVFLGTRLHQIPDNVKIISKIKEHPIKSSLAAAYLGMAGYGGYKVLRDKDSYQPSSKDIINSMAGVTPYLVWRGAFT